VVAWLRGRGSRRSYSGHIEIAVAVAVAVAVVDFAVAVRRLALAKAIEDPKGGLQGCRPFFIGTGMSRMKNPCAGNDVRAGDSKRALFFGYLSFVAYDKRK
jgi:hypothetical protein